MNIRMTFPPRKTAIAWIGFYCVKAVSRNHSVSGKPPCAEPITKYSKTKKRPLSNHSTGSRNFRCGGQANVSRYDWSIYGDLTRFWLSDSDLDQLPLQEQARGNRFIMKSEISYPIISGGYFFTPKAILNILPSTIWTNRLMIQNR